MREVKPLPRVLCIKVDSPSFILLMYFTSGVIDFARSPSCFCPQFVAHYATWTPLNLGGNGKVLGHARYAAVPEPGHHSAASEKTLRDTEDPLVNGYLSPPVPYLPISVQRYGAREGDRPSIICCLSIVECLKMYVRVCAFSLMLK